MKTAVYLEITPERLKKMQAVASAFIKSADANQLEVVEGVYVLKHLLTSIEEDLGAKLVEVRPINTAKENAS